MQYMRIKVGEHEGIPEYREVSVINAQVAADYNTMKILLKSGHEIVEFPHKITLTLNRIWHEPGFPVMMAKYVE